VGTIIQTIMTTMMTRTATTMTMMTTTIMTMMINKNCEVMPRNFYLNSFAF